VTGVVILIWAEFGAVSSCVKFLLPLQGEPF